MRLHPLCVITRITCCVTASNRLRKVTIDWTLWRARAHCRVGSLAQWLWVAAWNGCNYLCGMVLLFTVTESVARSRLASSKSVRWVWAAWDANERVAIWQQVETGGKANTAGRQAIKCHCWWPLGAKWCAWIATNGRVEWIARIRQLCVLWLRKKGFTLFHLCVLSFSERKQKQKQYIYLQQL